MALEHTVHERLDLVLLADVADPPLAAPVLGGGRGLIQGVGPPAAHHHMRSERRQLQGAGPPQTGPAAADERHMALEQAGREELGGHRRAG